MRFVSGLFKITGKSLFLATSFGVGFSMFARPWADSPIWAKPMELVKNKKEQLSTLQLLRDIRGFENFESEAEFQQIIHNEKFSFMPIEKLVPESHKHNQVSQSLLNLGDPIMMVNRDEGELVVFGKANEDMVAIDNKIHNGILLTLIDESLCFCGFDKLPNKRGVTAKLKVNFENKLNPGSNFVLTAKVVSSRGRKVVIEGTMKSLDSHEQLATAECILVEPKWFKWLSWVDLF